MGSVQNFAHALPERPPMLPAGRVSRTVVSERRQGNLDLGASPRLLIVRWQNCRFTARTPGRAKVCDGSHPERLPAMTSSSISISRHLVSAMAVAVFLLTMSGCGAESAAQDAGTKPPVPAQAAVTTPASSDAAPPAPSDSAPLALSDMARAGEELFNANCSLCHGVNASGTRSGANAHRPDLPPGPSLGLQLSQCRQQGSSATPLDVWRHAPRRDGVLR